MIRQAEAKDVQKVMELFKVILTDMELPIMRQVPWATLKSALAEAASQKGFRYAMDSALVKEMDGEIAGFCFGYFNKDMKNSDHILKRALDKYQLPYFEIFWDHETLLEEWYLDSVVVKPAFRGKGIGTELLQAAYEKAAASGAHIIGLNVDHRNPKALKLYQQQGFQSVHQITLSGHQYDHMQKKVR